MLLYHAMQEQPEHNFDSAIFIIIEQIKHGDAQDPTLRVKIAELNYKAASKAMGNSNSAAAYLYANAAIKLLPPDHWESHYDLSRNIFLVLGNAAYADRRLEKATSALDTILCKGKSLNDKLDAYYLKISLLHGCQKVKEAYDTTVDVLLQLGEHVPEEVEPATAVKMVANIQAKLSKMTEEDLMSMKKMESELHYSLMRFLNYICFIAYFVKPQMLKWFACRTVELTLEHGICKYSALGLMRYALVLGGKLIHETDESYRVGKMALKLNEQFDATDLVPCLHEVYYALIAVHVEPLQSCADMLKRGFEIGLSVGDIQTALSMVSCLIFYLLWIHLVSLVHKSLTLIYFISPYTTEHSIHLEIFLLWYESFSSEKGM